MSDEAPCGKCGKSVTYEDNGVGCEGICGQWYHIACIGMDFDFYMTLVCNENALWKCDDCMTRNLINRNYSTGEGKNSVYISGSYSSYESNCSKTNENDQIDYKRKFHVSVKKEKQDYSSKSFTVPVVCKEMKKPISDLFVAVKKERDVLSELVDAEEGKEMKILEDLVPYVTPHLKEDPDGSPDLLKECDIKKESEDVTIEEHSLLQEDSNSYTDFEDVMSCLQNGNPATEERRLVFQGTESSFHLPQREELQNDTATGETVLLAECHRLPQDESSSNFQKQGANIYKLNKSLIFQCKHCSSEFSSNIKFLKHIVVSKPCYSERPFCCDQCSATFIRYHHLERHQNSHYGIRHYQCKMCYTSFSSVDKMRKHKISVHKNLLTFSELNNLLCQVNKYQCHFCVKSFQTKSHISDHMRVHTGEKPFECKFCKKCFRRQSGLRAHMSSHTYSTFKFSKVDACQGLSSEHFQCDSCGNKFYNKASLSTHISRKCVLKCIACSKTFQKPLEYRRHIKQSGCSWLFKCKICNKGFARERNLSRHLHNHSLDYFLECNNCKKCFKRKTNLINHFQSRNCKCI